MGSVKCQNETLGRSFELGEGGEHGVDLVGEEEALLVWGNLVRNGAQRRGSVHGAGQPPSREMAEEWEQAFP